MLYQIIIGITAISWQLIRNKTREDALLKYICPFINREITLHDGQIFNMATYGSMKIFKTERAVDSDWPVSKNEYVDKHRFDYDLAIFTALETSETDVTEELFREAVLLITSGKYKEMREQVIEI